MVSLAHILGVAMFLSGTVYTTYPCEPIKFSFPQTLDSLTSEILVGLAHGIPEVA
jgi:hypothetical protein